MGFFDEPFLYKDKGADILRYAPEPSPENGFANLPSFIVVGKKKATNRKNTRKILSHTAEGAAKIAIEREGLMEPLEIAPAPFEPAKSLKREYGLKVPKGSSEWDAFIFECCVGAGDTQHIPAAFMSYLTAKEIPMTWLAGRNYAVSKAGELLSPRDRAAFYAYAVHCAISGDSIGNIEHEPDRDKYYRFADEAVHYKKLWASIMKRPSSDYWNPAQNTIAYEAAYNYILFESLE